MALTMYLLRHGETEFSRTGDFCGDTDAPLTAVGRAMAHCFADRYRTMSWNAVYCSPLQRTRQTAQPLCNATGAHMELRDGLRELSYGAWEGKTPTWAKQNHGEDYERWLVDPAWNPPTGGETSKDIAIRSSAVINEIVKKHTDGNVLVVSHKATIRIILCELLGIELGRYRDRIDALAGSVAKVVFNEHGPKVLTIGDRSHLSMELQSLPGS